MLNAAMIGFGGIAQGAHLPAYQTLFEKGKARLVAVCDIDPARFTQKVDINLGAAAERPDDLHTYTDLEEMLRTESIDLVDICLPTYLHAPMACDMLRRGYHVLSEKPMAISPEDCAAMLEAARTSKGYLMIGQCLRFSAAYTFLRESLDSGRFGRPVSAVFRRMSAPPMWSWENWIMDRSKSGSCLLDLHIHDLDIIRFLFGEPQAVSCVTADVYAGDDVAHSRLLYDDMAVMAIGDWSQQGAGFTADYRIGFEKATVILEQDVVTVYPREGEPWTPELSADSMYMRELESLIDSAVSGIPNTMNTPESAALSVRLAETLRASARQNGKTLPWRDTL